MLRSVFELAILSAILMKTVTAQDEGEQDVEETLDEGTGDDAVVAPEEPEEVYVPHLEWKEGIEALGYESEEWDVITDDGWVLPLYHITNNVDPDKQDKDVLGPVLIVHGSMSSATTYADYGASIPFQLFDEGFDVWMANMRGTKETRCAEVTETYDDGTTVTTTIDCGEDSLFSVQDMAEKDLLAFVTYILDSNDKYSTLNLIGFSRGTLQILVGLTSLGDELQSKVDTAVLLAPCLYNEPSMTVQEHTAWTAWRSGVMGINNTYPEDWDADVEEICDIAETTDDDYLASAAAYQCAWMSVTVPMELVDWGSQDYMYQIAETDTFQKMIPREDFEDGIRTAEELRLSDIRSTRVALYVGAADYFCPVGQAKRLYDEIGTDMKSLVVIEYVDEDAEDEDLVQMGHFEWAMPLSEDTLTRVSNTLRDGASYLAVAASAAAVSAIALF